MIKAIGHMGKVPYKVDIQTPSGNTLIADEPREKGGQDQGFAPKELLAAALVACTCATIRTYVNRKEWDLEAIEVTVEIQEADDKTIFDRHLRLEGKLDEEQRSRLLAVANACPVHKILTHTITVNTLLADP